MKRVMLGMIVMALVVGIFGVGIVVALDTSCTSEGGSYAIVPGAKPCCGGLIVISCDVPNASGDCYAGHCVGASYCTRCGDGTCKSPENKCNCPGDCNSSRQVICTKEAKVCSKGISVSRNASNNCEFDPCPAQDAGCRNLYWIDNTNKGCGQKEFCGAYMYYGLQTFETKGECEQERERNREREQVACTQEAKLCDDGVTYVSRNSSNGCKFDKCPGEDENECSADSDCPQPKCAGAQAGAGQVKCAGMTSKCLDGKCVLINEKVECSADESKCNISLSNGRKAEIKVMPETASERAIERLGQLGFNVALKEVGGKAVYEVSGEKEGKIFGLFRAKGKVSALVNAETGEIEKVNKPWWSFLASGI